MSEDKRAKNLSGISGREFLGDDAGIAAKTAAAKEAEKEFPEEKFSLTHLTLKIDGETLKYTATTGRMQMRDPSGKIKSNIFFTAYVQDKQEDKSRRPITFAFNGGPGSSSIWLHLGALGPQRVLLTEEGKALPPPYKLVPNEYTWLDFTDLFFIDPVGTGYSRSAPGIDPKEFYGVKEDVESVGEFIRLYVTRYKRWLSPKFIAGESYETTRTAGLSAYLQNGVGMNLNGLFLISSVLNFQTISFTPDNDLPFILYLPSYTCAAWYHRKLSPELQADLPRTRMEVEQFALNDYLLALAKGNELTATKANRLWNWQSGIEQMGYVNVATTLQRAMSENKVLKVFVASGYYDLDTAYFATKYTADHLRLDPSLREHITLSYYDAGHQMYTHLPSLKKLKADVATFFKKALANVAK